MCAAAAPLTADLAHAPQAPQSRARTLSCSLKRTCVNHHTQATWPYGYWIRDHNLQCYNGTHLRVYVPVGVVAFVVLCLAPPVASFVILWRRRKQLAEPQVQLRYGFLYSRYK